ncbi:MAG: DedA family protein [Allosphingosinicella sp.]|uniref:DedA family protein n=1 Tax=Allosphingosinicella sp. TaxID=2823234 RepID=UPI00392BDE4D
MNDIVADTAAFISEHRGWAGPLIGLLAFGESLAVVGLLIPATAMMIAFGGLIGTGVIDPLPVYAGAVGGAILGDWVSYAVGRRVGPAVYRRRPLNRHRGVVARARMFFRRHGFLAVFLGRFLGPIRATVPLVAGVMQMDKGAFQAANILSAMLWVPAILAPGYLATRNAGSIEELGGVHLIGFGTAIVLLTFAAGIAGVRLLGGSPKQRQLRRARVAARARPGPHAANILRKRS